MAKKRTQDERADQHKYPVLSLRPSPELRDVVADLARQERRSLSQMILLLVEQALEVRALWPPKPSDSDECSS